MLCIAAACSWALWPSCMYNIHYTSQLSSQLRWWWVGGWSGVKFHIRQHTLHIPAQLTTQMMMGWGGGLVWSFTSDSRVFCTHTNWITSTRCRHVDITNWSLNSFYQYDFLACFRSWGNSTQYRVACCDQGHYTVTLSHAKLSYYSY